MAIVVVAILVPVWIFVPDNSKFWVTLKLVIPLLGPAAAVLSGAYYLSIRMRRSI